MSVYTDNVQNDFVFVWAKNKTFNALIYKYFNITDISLHMTYCTKLILSYSYNTVRLLIMYTRLTEFIT